MGMISRQLQLWQEPTAPAMAPKMRGQLHSTQVCHVSQYPCAVGAAVVYPKNFTMILMVQPSGVYHTN